MVEEAALALQRGLAIAAGHEMLYAVQEQLQELAAIAALRGKSITAGRLLGASERLREEVGAAVWDRPDLDRTVSLVLEALGDARMEHVWAEGRAMSTEHAIELARSIN